MAWNFVLTDLQGTVLGEVSNADERKVNLPHLRTPTASFRVPLYHDRAQDLLTTDTLLKCYRTDNISNTRTLAFNGPVVSVEEATTGDTGPTLAVTAAGPFWRLAKRIIPGSVLRDPTTHKYVGTQYGSAASPRDLGLIAFDILSDVNGVSFPNGYTGIAAGTQTASISGTYTPPPLMTAAEAIATLATGYNGIEFVVVPTEPTASAWAWPTIGTMNVGPASAIGVSRPDAIFEYGTGKANVGSYSRQITRDAMITRAWINVNGYPDGVPLDSAGVPLYDLFSVDSDQIASRGLLEDVVPDNGVTDTTLRTSIANFHLGIRKIPRQIITFNPVVNAKPAPFVDYNVGDTIRARACVRGTTRFDANFRIWGLNFSIDQNGNEGVALDLVVP